LLVLFDLLDFLSSTISLKTTDILQQTNKILHIPWLWVLSGKDYFEFAYLHRVIDHYDKFDEIFIVFLWLNPNEIRQFFLFWSMSFKFVRFFKEKSKTMNLKTRIFVLRPIFDCFTILESLDNRFFVNFSSIFMVLARKGC
jgi:hypothetical protein